jgi:hypothetical protein
MSGDSGVAVALVGIPEQVLEEVGHPESGTDVPILKIFSFFSKYFLQKNMQNFDHN